MKRKLSPKREAELLAELELRRLFRDKVLCQRYGVSRSYLRKLQVKACEKPDAHFASQTGAVVVFNTNWPQRAKA